VERTPETTAAGALEAARHFLDRWQDPFTRSSADDFAQEAALQAWSRRATLREPTKWGAFVRTIARRCRYRAMIRDARLSVLSLDAEVEDAEELSVPEPSVPELRVAGRRVPLRRCVDELDRVLPRLGPLNEGIVRNYYEGFSCGELAERYGLPEETVKVRLHRSRGRIRRAFEGRVGRLAPADVPSC
jgi:RNA polymerase sigma-70 factor (ECF subfamily)